MPYRSQGVLYVETPSDDDALVSFVKLGRGHRLRGLFDSVVPIQSMGRTADPADLSVGASCVFRPNPGQIAYTPDMVEERFGDASLDRVRGVVIRLGCRNANDVISLVEWWSAYGKVCVVKLCVVAFEPSFPEEDDNTLFECKPCDAFRRCGRCWVPTESLRTNVRLFFDSNPLVRVRI